MNAKLQDRINRLMPGGKPHYIRCYYNPHYLDCYTVVYTKKNCYVGMDAHPFSPQGIGQHGESDSPIDRPAYAHLGRRISFDDLPDDCKRLVMQEYTHLWDLTEESED